MIYVPEGVAACCTQKVIIQCVFIAINENEGKQPFINRDCVCVCVHVTLVTAPSSTNIAIGISMDFSSFCVISICAAAYTLCYTSNPDTCSNEIWKPSEKSFQILLCSTPTYTLHTNTHMYRILFICTNVCIHFDLKCARTYTRLTQTNEQTHT